MNSVYLPFLYLYLIIPCIAELKCLIEIPFSSDSSSGSSLDSSSDSSLESSSDSSSEMLDSTENKKKIIEWKV